MVKHIGMLGKDVINCSEEENGDKRISKIEFLISSVKQFQMPFCYTSHTNHIHLYAAEWYAAFLLI